MITGTPYSRSTRKTAFTLIEMATAVFILMFVMFVLFKLLIKVQDEYSTTVKRGDMYQDAHLIFDIMARDIQAMVVDSSHNFSVDSTEMPTGFKIVFISDSGVGARSSDLTDRIEVKTWIFNR